MRLDIETVRDWLGNAGFVEADSRDDREAFGSWYIVLEGDPRVRVMWDGRDGWLYVQQEYLGRSRFDERWASEWRDYWIGKEPGEMTAEVLVRQVTWAQRWMIDGLLVEGINDWLTMADAVHVVMLAEPRAAFGTVRFAAVGLMTELLAAGLVIGGSLDGSGNFVPDVTVEEAIQRVLHDWPDDARRLPTPGLGGWFSLTPEGEARARAIVQRDVSRTD